MSTYEPAPTDADELHALVSSLIEIVDQRLVELVHDREMLAAQREAEETP